jgi:hypothetical protein
VQGKNSSIPTFDWITKQEKNKSFIEEFINVTINKKQKTRLIDPTIKITPDEARRKIKEIDVMTCDIFLLFAYWQVFQRHWHFDQMNPSEDCIIC